MASPDDGDFERVSSKGVPPLCPPPQHRSHHRPPKGQIQNHFYSDLLTVWTPWKASEGLSYVLGSPSPSPCDPQNIRHITEHLGAKFPTTFISIFFSSDLSGRLQREYPNFWGTPSPICPPLGGRGGGLGETTGEEDKPQREKEHFLFRKFFSISCRFGFSTGRIPGDPPPPFASLWGAGEGV